MATPPFGTGDASYRAAGGTEGLLKLSHRFYELMDTLPEGRSIRVMHPADLTSTTERLAFFLCGWLGGPRLYNEKFGGINIPMFHQHLHIGEAERNAWLSCMAKAIGEQDYSPEFKHYLLTQLHVPAERIRLAASGLI
ncbi:MAG: group II truncated hemoglobin [Stenotrophobium sp.]